MRSDALKIPRILVVSRDAAILDSLQAVARLHAWQVEVAAEVRQAMERVQSATPFDLLLLDQLQDRMEGMQALCTLRRARPALPVILIGQPEDADYREESIRQGARDYLLRPIEDHQFALVVRSNLSAAIDSVEINLTSEDVESVSDGRVFIGISPVTKMLRAQIASISADDAPVFLFGEPGSGKETIARLLHGLSVRSGFEFAKVNCAALPEELLEREIFGTVGAENLRGGRGKLELCHQGVIFVEEITEMPLRLQAKLAEALQGRALNREETSKGFEIDVRVVAASSISINQAVSEQRLHSALARLFGSSELRVPALRERKDELPVLSHYFMYRIAKQYGLPPQELPSAVTAAWQAYHWPGNLKELEQAVKRHLVTGGKIPDFKASVAETKNGWQRSYAAGSRGADGGAASARLLEGGICGHKSLRAFLQSVKEEAEKSAIALALEKTGWNRKAAARMLKTSYRSVLYKIEQYQMHCPTTSASRVTAPPGGKPADFGGHVPNDSAVVDLSGLAGGE